LIMRYAIVSRKRFRRKDKERYLSGLQRDLTSMSVSTKITQAKLKGERIHNLYVGDLQKAKQIIWTYYDTPKKTFSLYPHKIGQRPPAILNLFTMALPNLLLIALGILFYMLIGRNLQESTDAWKTLFFFAFYVALLSCMVFFKKGVANGISMNRNSASVVGMMQLIDYLKSKSIAFAFVDFDCINGYGEAMLRAYVGDDKRFIKLDCIGSKDPIHFLQEDESGVKKVSSIEGRGQYIVCRAKEENGEYLVKHANSMKDTEITAESINEVISTVVKAI